MKVRDLVKHLKKFPQDVDVILSHDAEGNRFRALHELGIANATPTGGLFGEDDFDVHEANAPDKPINAVILWPA